ncbi:hypothetical protein BDQ17DRAFT_1332859 [Cyathus striatus]|nr:hypothetical protein BDQ17DRAFT_1332859 [Cyathus striatus]
MAQEKSSAMPVTIIKEEKKLEIVQTDWNANECAETWHLLSHLTSDMDMKNGLFPLPGAHPSSKHEGGSVKADWHWKLAILMFKDHPSYIEAFTAALTTNTASACKPWVDRIKNCIFW